MRSTNLAFDTIDADYEAFVSDSDLMGFTRPRDIVTDPMLTVARKRQLPGVLGLGHPRCPGHAEPAQLCIWSDGLHR